MDMRRHLEEITHIKLIDHLGKYPGFKLFQSCSTRDDFAE